MSGHSLVTGSQLTVECSKGPSPDGVLGETPVEVNSSTHNQAEPPMPCQVAREGVVGGTGDNEPFGQVENRSIDHFEPVAKTAYSPLTTSVAVRSDYGDKGGLSVHITHDQGASEIGGTKWAAKRISLLDGQQRWVVEEPVDLEELDTWPADEVNGGESTQRGNSTVVRVPAAFVGNTGSMFNRQRTCSMPDHTFRQRDLGLLQQPRDIRSSENGPLRHEQDVDNDQDRTSLPPSQATSSQNEDTSVVCGKLPDLRPEHNPSESPILFNVGEPRQFHCEKLRLAPLKTAQRQRALSEEASPTSGDTHFRPISPHQDSFSQPTISYPLSIKTPSHHSRSPSPTLTARSLSPVLDPRRRSNTTSGCCLRANASYFLTPPRSPARLPRDPIQPSRGSISDLSDRQSTEEAGEEADLFTFRPFQRQRSSTCPENRAWRRRKQAVANSRPPTPPPLVVSPRTSLSVGSSDDGVTAVRGLNLARLSLSSDLSELPEDTTADDPPLAATGQSSVKRMANQSLTGFRFVGENNDNSSTGLCRRAVHGKLPPLRH